MHIYNIIEQGAPLVHATQAIVVLHGRGASAQDILPLAEQFCDEACQKTCHIAAPQATHHTWYPQSFMAPVQANEPWLSSAVETVKRLLDSIVEHVPSERLYIMGFSQGACLALEVATRFARRYAGVAAFTGGLIGAEIATERYQGNFDATPVFIGNSDRDPHVPVQRSEASKRVMESLGATVQLKVYPNMPHTIVADEIAAVRTLMF
jgi:phospholipase/carboxylesterase